MAMLSRWTPFKSRLPIGAVPEFEDLFRGFPMRPLWRDVEGAPDMRLDLSEDDKNYRVKVDIPGVDKNDISVSVEGNQVTISAEVKRETERKEEKQLISERYLGQCYRAFTLPTDVDDAKTEASYANGVLTLTLPKKANGKSRRITIS